MMFLRSFVATLCLAVAVSGSLVLHDSRSAHPEGFVHHGAAPATQAIKLRVGLASANITGLQAKLQSISNPTSPEYGQWLTADQVKAYVAPKSSTLSAFHSFAKANGLSVSNLSDTSEWMELTTTVEHVNSLFGANYQTYSHSSTGALLTRTLAYSLPKELVGHVDMITPSTGFEMQARSHNLGPHVKRTAPHCDTSAPHGYITPNCLQDMYGIPAQSAKVKNNTLLVPAYGDLFAQRADLSAFLKLERPDMNPNTTYTFVSLDNGTDPQSPANAGVEANLDIQYTVGIATGVNTTFLSVGGDYSNDPNSFAQAFLDTVSYLATVDNPPNVVTVSYGDNEANFGPADAQKFCDGYMALGARGISVIYASGDGGVRGGSYDIPASQCADNTFIPSFPPSCPYVTAVGSTFGLPEVAANFSSGGFSNYFPRPWYQDQVVPGYLNTVPASFPGVFNRTGRGFPDVATQGINFRIIEGGTPMLVTGTSASSPTFASIIALLNDQLVQAGKKPLGFLNPFLYLAAGPAGAFNDVTSGKNAGPPCNNTATGFTAEKGWDATTGFGTPNYPKLLLAALAANSTL